jgi:hypothetical protein
LVATLIGFALFAGLVLFILHLADAHESNDAQRALERANILSELNATAHQELTQPAWIEKDKGTVRLPIARAMELSVEELRAKPVRATTEKANPQPSSIVPPVPQS